MNAFERSPIVQQNNMAVKFPAPAPRLIPRVDVDAIESRVQRIARRDAAISPVDPTMKLDGMAGAAIDLACEQILEIEHPPLAAYQFNALYWSYIAAFADARRQVIR
jgi:hypothetical protein